LTLTYDAFDEGATRFHRWVEVATLIVVLHLGAGIMTTVHWSEEESDPMPSGAVMMELAALAVAPPDFQDLALGPLVEESVPTPIPTEETMPEELDLPSVEEAPLAPEPELVLPQLKPVETQQDIKEEPELLQQEQKVTEVNTSSAAATAPPKVDAVPDKTVKAQTVGERAKPNRAEITWQKALLFHLNRHKRYPSTARAKRIQGIAKVEFKIDAGGKLVEAHIVKGSGSDVLDEEAIAVLRRASPFPAPPDRAPSEVIRLALPIEFTIKR
jgi:protein TonB